MTLREEIEQIVDIIADNKYSTSNAEALKQHDVEVLKEKVAEMEEAVEAAIKVLEELI